MVNFFFLGQKSIGARTSWIFESFPSPWTITQYGLGKAQRNLQGNKLTYGCYQILSMSDERNFFMIHCQRWCLLLQQWNCKFHWAIQLHFAFNLPLIWGRVFGFYMGKKLLHFLSDDPNMKFLLKYFSDLYLEAVRKHPFVPAKVKRKGKTKNQ